MEHPRFFSRNHLFIKCLDAVCCVSRFVTGGEIIMVLLTSPMANRLGTFGDSIFCRENKVLTFFFQGPGRLSEFVMFFSRC